MRKFVLPLAALVALGLVARFSVAADAAKDHDKDSKDKKITGVLIDQHCGEDKFAGKDDAEKKAAGHPKSCALKCKDSGYGIIVGKKLIKFDDEGNKKAIAYLEKHDKMRVTVTGEKEGDDKFKVESIAAAEKKEGKSEKSDDK